VSSLGDGRPRLRDQLNRLCTRHHERLVRFALAFGRPGGRATAEDIVQNALLAVLRKGARLPEEKEERLNVVLGFVAKAALKHRSRKQGKRETELPDDSSRLLGDGTDAWEAFEHITLCDDLQAALATLTEAEREVVELRYFRGMSYAEIAKRRRCAVSTCKNQWASAREKLKRFLGGAYGDSVQ